ncbi:MAG: DUF1587 domain-containing protein, partial [Planctomycetaceae bacterium]
MVRSTVHRIRTAAVCIILGFVSSISAAADEDFAIQQWLSRHCQACHSGADSKADITITSLTDDFSDKRNREQWLVVLEQLTEGNMPPEDQPRPPLEEVERLTQQIGERVREAETAQRETEGRVVMRRLNRAEYANTVRDLLGVE